MRQPAIIGGGVVLALALLTGCSVATGGSTTQPVDGGVAQPASPAEAGPIEITWDRPELVEECFGPIAKSTDLNAGGIRTWALAEFPAELPAPKAGRAVICHQVSPTSTGQLDVWWLFVEDSVDAYTIGDQWITDLAAAGLTEVSERGENPRTPEPNVSYYTEVLNVERSLAAWIHDTNSQGYRFQAQRVIP